jgi:hypothetical protein
MGRGAAGAYRPRFVVAARRGGEDREHPAADAAGAHPGEIEVAAAAARDEAPVVVARERVVVAVEDAEHG